MPIETLSKALILSVALVALGGCSPAGEEGPAAGEPAAAEAGEGHLAVRTLYASGGPEADDARYVVETAGGERAAGPTGRSAFDLEAGRYRVTATLGEAEAAAEAEVRGGERTELEVVLDAGILEVGALAVEGGAPMADARFRILSAEQDIRGDRRSIAGPTSRTSFVLPAGAYLVRAEEGEAAAEREVRVSAGERTEAQIVLDAGVLQVRAVEADGSAPSDRPRWEVLAAEEDLRGGRERVVGPTSRDQFVLPAGGYVVQAQVEGRAAREEVTVVAGERLEVEIALPALDEPPEGE